MRKLVPFVLLQCFANFASAQTSGTELLTLIGKLAYDSTGYENVGDWAVGQPKKYPVKWKADKIEMSNDTSINFYRLGTAEITVKGKTYKQGSEPVKWNVMLKGARSGYSSFSILSSPSAEISPKLTLDSLFGAKLFAAKRLKACDANPLSGFYYYEMKLPKKDKLFLKITWLTLKGKTALRIDGFDNWSKYAAKLDCKN